MTKRTYTQKDGTIWEWEETQESAKALETYWKTIKENESKSTNS
jgi:hypothetical protein